MIESEPYEESQFKQLKYRVFIETTDKRYYIGDLRKFASNDEFISYINIDKIREQEPEFVLNTPTQEQMVLINHELNMSYLSRNLMDDTITYREKLKNDYNIIL